MFPALNSASKLDGSNETESINFMKDKPVANTDWDQDFTGRDTPIGGTASDAAHGLTGSQS